MQRLFKIFRIKDFFLLIPALAMIGVVVFGLLFYKVGRVVVIPCTSIDFQSKEYVLSPAEQSATWSIYLKKPNTPCTELNRFPVEEIKSSLGLTGTEWAQEYGSNRISDDLVEVKIKFNEQE